MLVNYEQQGYVGVITINRPQAMNSLSGEVIEQLSTVLDTISLTEVRCLVLTGAGDKAFVAGADIAAMLPLSQSEGQQWGERGNEVFRKLEQLPVPSIAAINGFALGGGCELAMACDIRLAAENAQFGQPEVTLGITAGFGGTQRLPRLVGQGMAKELLYTGLRVDAQEALRIGLVNHVYPADSLMDEAIKLAQRVAKAAPVAVRATKRAVNLGYDLPVDQALALEAKCFGGCFETDDQKNAMQAFVEKRKPEPFTGK